MSSDTFQMLQNLNLNDLKIRLVIQCAPVLAGIKIANLLNIRGQEVASLITMLEGTPIDVFLLYQNDDKAVLILYRREELEEYLFRDKVLYYLQLQGYWTWALVGMLQELKERYTNYRAYGGRFPHEMGLFLGYPEEDVKGFIEKEGQGFLYCGYWKVYSDLSATKAIFEKYDRVSDIAVKLVIEGNDILSLVDLFHNKEALRLDY